MALWSEPTPCYNQHQVQSPVVETVQLEMYRTPRVSSHCTNPLTFVNVLLAAANYCAEVQHATCFKNAQNSVLGAMPMPICGKLK